MAIGELEDRPIEVEKRLLVSGARAAKLIGVSRSVWPAIAREANIEPVFTGRRNLWRRLDVERLVGIRENA